jgi:hypothetical protein
MDCSAVRAGAMYPHATFSSSTSVLGYRLLAIGYWLRAVSAQRYAFTAPNDNPRARYRCTNNDNNTGGEIARMVSPEYYAKLK